MDDDERAAFDDLTLILSDADQGRYREDPVGFASRYWTSQNPRYLTPYNERKLEHYARLVHADLLYAAPEIGLRGWETQRGRLVVRYGPPLSDVTITGDFGEVISGFGLAALASEIESGRQFGERFDMADRSNLFNVWDYGDFKFVFEDPLRNGEYRLYSPPADFFADADARFAETMDYEMIARETFREQPERYVYEPPGRDVRIPYLVTAFKGEGGQADLYVHYGIPLGPSADLSGDLVPLTVKTGAFLINDDRDITRRAAADAVRAQNVAGRVVRGGHAVDGHAADDGRARSGDGVGRVRDGGRRGRGRAAPRGRRAGLRRRRPRPERPHAGLSGRGGLRAGRRRRERRPRPSRRRRHPARAVERVQQRAADLPLLRDLPPRRERRGSEPVRRRGDAEAEGHLVRASRSSPGACSAGTTAACRSSSKPGGTGPDDATYTILDAAEQEPGLYTLTLRVRDTLTGRTAERTSDLYLE